MIDNDVAAQMFLGDVLANRKISGNEYTQEFIKMSMKLKPNKSKDSVMTQVSNQYIEMYPSDSYAKEVYKKYIGDNYKNLNMESKDSNKYKQSKVDATPSTSISNTITEENRVMSGNPTKIRCKKCQSTKIAVKGRNKLIIKIGDMVFKKKSFWVRFKSKKKGLCLSCLHKWKMK